MAVPPITFRSTDIRAATLRKLNELVAAVAFMGHVHEIANVLGLQDALDARALLAHTHTIANVAGLQAALDSKLGASTGTAAQYWRGDNTWQDLSKAAVGLANADNTSDADKPVSTAMQSALNAKAGTAAATTAANGLMSSADKAKLNGVATAATANATDAALRDRATHTGAQAIGTVTGLQAALDAKVAGTRITISAATPSGGVDGNLWFKV